MPAMHRDHRCLSTGSAQLLYIKEASSGHTHYGLHLYRLRNSKKSDDHHANNPLVSSHHPHRLRSAERSSAVAAAGCDSRSSADSGTTLERLAHHRPCSANDNSVQLHDQQQQQQHTGTVWLGICGRGIDIYEVCIVIVVCYY